MKSGGMIASGRLIATAMAVSAVAVSGCGWEPLYADPQTPVAAAALHAIKVAPISERAGQQLETELRDSLNPDHQTAKQLYQLNVTLSRSLSTTGLQSQGLGTRGQVNMSATYQLLELATKKVLQTGVIHSTDSFDIQANGYSTVVAENDATTRDVEEIRREIVARLTIFLQGKDPATT
ncbi:MAG TPA: LPS assembly lipoprotein LptE [Stellaceae bacterium]|nr:LPS assembly lipoprotein LptE [Stellaceae bacterium]